MENKIGNTIKEARINKGLTLQEVADKGVQLIDKTQRGGAEGMTIAFLHPKSTAGILTEFCEKK